MPLDGAPRPAQTPSDADLLDAYSETVTRVVERVARDGVAQSPVERADSRTVALPAGESTWTIEAATGEPRALQVFTIRQGG